MRPLILLVDDNPDVLMNLQITLEFNEYQVLTAENGQKALKILNGLETPPDIIVSDIMMPEMNGYEFFRVISNSPKLSQIPFFFLTARTSPNDVRFGKILGVDDYLTKPINIDDLLARISGLISRRKKIKTLNSRIGNIFSTLNVDLKPSIKKLEKVQVQFFLIDWDDLLGPQVKVSYPSKSSFSITLEDLGIQLYQTTVSIYGHSDFHKAHGILLSIKNINRDGYLFFDSIPDSQVRGGKKQYMLSIIAPKISYFESLRIKEIFTSLSSQIKTGKKWDPQDIWKKLSETLSTSLF